MRPRSNRNAGFTLIELMVVVTVMGIVVAASVPAITTAMAERRVAAAARDVIRIYRSARYASMSYGRAHLVQYWGESTLSGNDTFAFETYRGVAPNCFHNDWVDITDNYGPPKCSERENCVDSFYFDRADPNPDDDESVVIEGLSRQANCYEAGSNNRLWWATQWGAPDKVNPGTGFAVYRRNEDGPVSVVRKVLIPWGTGSPRIMQ